MNPLQRAWHEQGQSIWFDFIERGLLTSGGLERLVAEDGVRGVTSNPSIFQAAITGGTAYEESIRQRLAEAPSLDTLALYEALAVEDIRRAADILRPVYDGSDGGDGFVSLEVSPHLAADTVGTVEEARRLWRRVDRPNLMVKVPATAAGMPAITTLIAEGVNVNVTLMFSLAHYDAVATAYLAGLERCAAPSKVASVASFFVSRVDTAVDAELERIGSPEALALRGRAAIANSLVVYRRFEELFHGDAFRAARQRGARVQRPLWASTSTKNPSYRDVVYVEELMGPETVNTLPAATLEAFRDHGELRNALASPACDPLATMAGLARLGIDLAAVTERLQVDGVRAFAIAFDTLIQALETSRDRLRSA
jgi:transaldolase